MFQITMKILKWASPYKRRMILGFVMSLINSIFIAFPIFLSAQVFNRILSYHQIVMLGVVQDEKLPIMRAMPTGRCESSSGVVLK